MAQVNDMEESVQHRRLVSFNYIEYYAYIKFVSVRNGPSVQVDYSHSTCSLVLRVRTTTSFFCTYTRVLVYTSISYNFGYYVVDTNHFQITIHESPVSFP